MQYVIEELGLIRTRDSLRKYFIVHFALCASAKHLLKWCTCLLPWYGGGIMPGLDESARFHRLRLGQIETYTDTVTRTGTHSAHSDADT